MSQRNNDFAVTETISKISEIISEFDSALLEPTRAVEIMDCGGTNKQFDFFKGYFVCTTTKNVNIRPYTYPIYEYDYVFKDIDHNLRDILIMNFPYTNFSALEIKAYVVN